MTMKKVHPNYRRVKIHRNYTVEEVAELFGLHKNTVRSWIRAGLATTDNRRPMLILGQDLAAFLKVRRAKNKRPCKDGEIYCMRCRTPRQPAGGMADYTPVTEKFGNLTAICPACDAIMNRRVSLAKMEQVCTGIEVAVPETIRHLIERVLPTVNSDLSKE